MGREDSKGGFFPGTIFVVTWGFIAFFNLGDILFKWIDNEKEMGLHFL